MTDDPVSRRALLRSGVAAGSLVLAGCSGRESTGTPTRSGLLGGTAGTGTATADGRGTDGGDSDRTVDTDHPSAVVGEG
ncbi:MAG: hypothetical protein ABEJ94_05595 [Halorientalis sp.]